ncbi:MAG: succinyldiaminopimelate transaminase [Propionibacteriaceae bacterium]|nr:succinyldiaminopimelate transaminase [Propionibacteriaceae bacterium]
MSRLPDFPWDSLAGAKAKAECHQGGIVDLSVGTPVDPTPGVAMEALRAAALAPGYPQTWGTQALREAIIGYLGRRWNAGYLLEQQVLPVIGSKEFVAILPTLLGLGAQDVVVIPTLAYPTYDVGAKLAGCEVVCCDDPDELVALRPKLVWINSPANPHGQILDAVQTRAWVDATRAVGAVLASDECYGEFGWDAQPVSVLDAMICDGDTSGLIAVHSLSKRSNLAGYRAGFIAGDAQLVTVLLEIRKHMGMMVPAPVQAAMIPLLGDDSHVELQRARYAARRVKLRAALQACGFQIDHSQGSLYLWVTRDEDCWSTVDYFAKRGILVAPGSFYADAASSHVRVALTATDEHVAAACDRLFNSVV